MVTAGLSHSWPSRSRFREYAELHAGASQRVVGRFVPATQIDGTAAPFWVAEGEANDFDSAVRVKAAAICGSAALGAGGAEQAVAGWCER